MLIITLTDALFINWNTWPTGYRYGDIVNVCPVVVPEKITNNLVFDVAGSVADAV